MQIALGVGFCREERCPAIDDIIVVFLPIIEHRVGHSAKLHLDTLTRKEIRIIVPHAYSITATNKRPLAIFQKLHTEKRAEKGRCPISAVNPHEKLAVQISSVQFIVGIRAVERIPLVHELQIVNRNTLRNLGSSCNPHIAVLHYKVVTLPCHTPHPRSRIDIRRIILVCRHTGQIDRSGPVTHPHLGPAHHMLLQRAGFGRQFVLAHTGRHNHHRKAAILNPSLNNQHRLLVHIQISPAAARKQERQRQKDCCNTSFHLNR